MAVEPSYVLKVFEMDNDETYQSSIAKESGRMVNANDSATADDSFAILEENVHSMWLVSMIFSVVISVFVLYIIIALSCFSWRKKLCFTGRQSPEKNGANLLNTLPLICAWSILVYFLVELPLFVPQREPFCGVQLRITTVCGILTFGSVYFALWFRVYSVFYSNPIIRKESTKMVRMVSKLAVVFLLLMLVTISTVFLTAPAYRTSELGCLKLQSKDGNAFKWGMLVSSTVVFQATLLFLMVHPLYLHRKHMLHHGFDSRATMPVIRRAFVTAAICIVSDTINAVYAISNTQSLNYVRHTVYGCNMVVNLVALLLSFGDWRRRIAPCFCRRRNLGSFQSRNRTVLTHVYSIS